MTDKTTEALKLAEALENDAKEHREVSYGLDCPPERTANWNHALNCEAAARLIREALAKPVKQEPVAVISESAIGLVKLHSNGVSLPFDTPLYAAPVRTKDLTDEEIDRALDAANVPELPAGYESIELEIARAVIAADREKNNANNNS